MSYSQSTPQTDVPYIRPETVNNEVFVSTYYREKDFPKLMATLKNVGGEALVERFKGSCFGHFIDWTPRKKSNKALHHVLSRQIFSFNDEMWFYLCGVPVSFSTTDYALVTGLNFGGSSFDPTENHECDNVAAFRSFSCGKRMHVRELVKRVCDLNRRVADEDGDLYLQAVLVCVAHTLVLGSDMRVEAWVWDLVDDLDAFNKFPWGAYSYKVLRHYTTNVGRGGKYHLYGPAWALLVWSLERVPGLGASIYATTSNHIVSPRFRRWSFRSKPQLECLQSLFETKDGVLPLLPDSQEIASWYWTTAASQGPLEVRYKPPHNALAHGQQFPHRRSSGKGQNLRPDIDINCPRRTRSVSAHLPPHILHPKKNEADDVHRGKRERHQTSSSSGGSRESEPVPSPSEGPITRHWVKRLIRREFLQSESRIAQSMQKMMNKMYNKVKGKGKHKQQSDWFENQHHNTSSNVDSSDDCGFDNPNQYRHDPDWMCSGKNPMDAPRHSMPESSFYGLSWLHEGYLSGMHRMSNFEIEHRNPLVPLLSYGDFTIAGNNPATEHGNNGDIRGSYAKQISTWTNRFEPLLVDETIVSAYNKWLDDCKNGKNCVMVVKVSGAEIESDDFCAIEDASVELTVGTIDLYMLALRKRLNMDMHILSSVNPKNTIILDTDFFIYLNSEWSIILDGLPDYFNGNECHEMEAETRIRKWNPKFELISQVRGTSVEDGWLNAQQVLIPCLVGSHYIVTRIIMGEGKCQLFDPLSDRLTDEDRCNRFREIFAIVRLLPRILLLSRWYDDATIPRAGARRNFPELEPVFAPDYLQFTQLDDVSCGVFICMNIERLLSGGPSIEWGNDNYKVYRAKIAASIFGLCERRRGRRSVVR